MENVPDQAAEANKSRRRPAIIVGVIALAGVGLYALGSGGSNSNSGGGESSGGNGGGNLIVTPTTQAAAPTFENGAVWDKYGCLSDFTQETDAGGNVSVYLRPTDLCRSYDSASPAGTSFYYLFQRGKDSDYWVEEYGRGTNGNIYWQYPNEPEHLLYGGKGPIYDYEDGNFVSEASDTPFLAGIKAGIEALGEAQAADIVFNLEQATYTPVTASAEPAAPSTAEQQLTQLQAQYQQQEAKNQQLEQQLQQANQQSASASTTAAQNEKLYLEQ